MATAADRGWGPGWPNAQTDKIVSLRRADGVVLPVRREVVPMVTWLCDETERRGYNLRPGECWGFANRPIRGTSTPSNHSWGLAVDLNAPANPMGDRLITDMPAWMPKLWAEHGWRWGGTYTRRPDAMHYEYMGTPAQAAAWRPPSSQPAPQPTAIVINAGPTYEDATMQPHFVSLHSGGARLDGNGNGYWDLPGFPFDRVVTVNPNVANPPEGGYRVPDVGFLRWGGGIRVVAEEAVAGGGLDVVVWLAGP